MALHLFGSGNESKQLYITEWNFLSENVFIFVGIFRLVFMYVLTVYSLDLKGQCVNESKIFVSTKTPLRVYFQQHSRTLRSISVLQYITKLKT